VEVCSSGLAHQPEGLPRAEQAASAPLAAAPARFADEEVRKEEMGKVKKKDIG
jgi:hypothetical protein